MLKNYKRYFSVLIISTIILSNVNITYGAVTAPAKQCTQQNQTLAAISVSPIEVVNNPDKYLNKNITFNAEFVAFSSLGLDYKPAFRDGAKYIGVLIRRSDVTDHTIPLSEMKIFITREMAEKYIDIEPGDRISLSGVVFSNALGDPWMEAKTFKIIEQKNKTKNNDKK